MITGIILSYLWAFIIPCLLIAAVASYIYIPVFGRILAIALVAAASAYGSYELGYADRGKLDKSVELQKQLDIQTANLALAKQEAADNKAISDNAAAREKAAEDQAADLQSKVGDYEQQIAKQDAAIASSQEVQSPGKDGKCPIVHHTNGCILSPADVSGLRAIGSKHSSGDAPGAP